MLSAFKNFVVSFLIASVIFGIGAYFATKTLEKTMNDILIGTDDELNDIIDHKNPPVTQRVTDATTDPSGEHPIDKIPQGDSFNLLMVVTDYQPEVYDDYIPSLEELEQIIAGARTPSPIEPPSTGDPQGDPSVDPEDPAGNEDPTEPVKPEEIHYLTTDYRRVTASTIILVRFDKMTREIVYIPLSSILEVNTPAGSMRLGDTYGYYSKETDPNGFSYLVGKIEFLTGLTVDSYLEFNVTELSTVLSSLGNVTVQLPCSVYNNGSEYVTMLSAFETSLDYHGEIETVFSSGSVRLTPENALPLFILTERFSGDIANKTQVETLLATAYLNKFCSLSVAKMRTILEEWEANENIFTNITPTMITDQKEIIQMYSEGVPVNYVYPYTVNAGTGTVIRFAEPDQNSAINALKSYRQSN